MRKTIVAATLASSLLVLGVYRADAGPISWNYSTEGSTDDIFFLVGQGLTSNETESGDGNILIPYSDYGPKVGYVNNFYEKPELMADVTLTDIASGLRQTFSIPYTFSSTTADVIAPVLEEFEARQFTLGNNIYAISPFGDGNIGVSITSNSTTPTDPTPTDPEPTDPEPSNPDPTPTDPTNPVPVEPVPPAPVDPTPPIDLPTGPDGGVVATPEPATMLLAGLGIAGMGLTRLRRRSLKAAQPA